MENVHAVAICGMGAETPFGNGVSSFWQGLLDKKNAISQMDLFDLQGLACVQAGVIRMSVPAPPSFSSSPRSIQFAAAAGYEALSQAGIATDAAALTETALITASNFGMLDAGETALMPSDAQEWCAEAARAIPSAQPAEELANGLQLGGIRLPVSLSCASGAAAAAKAADLISLGIVRRALVIGFDAHSRFSWSGLCSLRTMTKEKIRPFDRHRSGTIFSEGAAAVLLESEEACKEREGTPLAWLSGWSTGNNGYHLTAPAPRGAGSLQVMRDALSTAGISPDQVDHINAHGTGTRANDVTETQAIEDLFGRKFSKIPVTSVKGSVGHLLGAAGTAELVASVLTIRNGLIPPTANHETPDPECPLRVVDAPLPGKYDTVLSNSAGFGGCNAALVITRDPVRPFSYPYTPLAITGAGTISALGIGREEFSAAWAEGESACFPMERIPWPADNEPPEVGEVPEFELSDFGITPKPYLDFASRYLLAACGEAIESAGWNRETLEKKRAGIAVGNAWGCTETAQRFFADYVRKGPRLVKPMLFPHTYANTAVSQASMEWSLKGSHGNTTSFQSASAWAMAEAAISLLKGETEIMLVAGCDALSLPRLHQAKGKILGEGAAALCLEKEESRVEAALAHLAGVGISKNLQDALSYAFSKSPVKQEQIVHCFAEGHELQALLPGIPCSSLSPLCGDTEGASFVMLLVTALETVKEGPVIVAVNDDSLSMACILTA